MLEEHESELTLPPPSRRHFPLRLTYPNVAGALKEKLVAALEGPANVVPDTTNVEAAKNARRETSRLSDTTLACAGVWAPA